MIRSSLRRLGSLSPRGLAVLAGLAFGAGGVSGAIAAEPDYQAWPGAGSSVEAQDTQSLIDELRDIIDQADRARAADPRFIADLRAALHRYDFPWQRNLVFDNFRDGDFTQSPAWQVAQGDFAVAWGGGLTSRVDAPAATAGSGQQGSQEVRPEDLAVAVLGQLLANRNRQQQDQAAGDQTAAAGQPAEIFLPTTVTNAFALTATLSGRPMDNAQGFDIAVYQDSDRRVGYRLSFTPGRGFALLRSSSRGTATIDSGGADIVLADGNDHLLEWTRAADGAMAVTVDGNEVLSTLDRGFRDPFAGFTLINRGGDYILRAIKIDGTT